MSKSILSRKDSSEPAKKMSSKKKLSKLNFEEIEEEELDGSIEERMN